MAFEMFGRVIRKIGVVGSGNIGPDIALHLGQAGAGKDVQVVVVDIAEAALQKGKAKLHKKLDKGVEVKVVRPEEAEAVKKTVQFTSDYGALKGADFVIEAATEALEIKRKIFAQVEGMVAEDAILASNSSHMEPEVIFAELKNRKRSCVIHYFFPAERNPLVEIVPGKSTDPELTQFLLRFYDQLGKVPLRVKSRFGFAIDPVFEGMFLAAALLVEENVATVKEVDAVACKVLGLGVGPFTAMNLTGGTALTVHGLKGYTKKIMAWFKVPSVVAKQVESGAPWPTAGKDEVVEVTPEKEKLVGDLLKGAFFGLCCEIADSGVSNVADLDMGVELGLVMKAPFRFMNELGPMQALRLAEHYAMRNPGFKVCELLRRQAEAEVPFDIPVVFRENRGEVAVVTVRRPRVLNALNGEVMSQLKDVFQEIKRDSRVVGAVLKGSGTKAFVSGADINELAALPDPQAAETFARKGHEVLHLIEALGKPVIAAMNGLAFGGGLEIAMACHARIAAAGQKVFAGQPEVKLGIIPGYGGTQRLVRWIGFDRAWPLLRTGSPVSTAEAKEAGLVLEEVEPHKIVDRAIEIVREAVSGKRVLAPIPVGPVPVPSVPPDIDIGGLSRRIDGILVDAVFEGARRTLAEGMAIEAKKFGECLTTKDMRIGLENFLKNGPKVPAKFIGQ
jgi:enoyl-CoA hydratase/3-hydroxyacyl-CoA dehydrogenase